VDASGFKLSKSEDAPGLAAARPAVQLVAALGFLGQEPPPELSRGRITDLWGWAVLHWQPGKFAGVVSRGIPGVKREQAQEHT
jgi:glutamyl-Q tRNA(Asp) synthetase